MVDVFRWKGNAMTSQTKRRVRNWLALCTLCGFFVASGSVAQGATFVAGGGNAATGTDGIAIGAEAYAVSMGIAIGSHAESKGSLYSLALGTYAKANYDYAIAVGRMATVGASTAISLGANAAANGVGSIAIGSLIESTAKTTTASGAGAIALGQAASTSADYAVAVGYTASAGLNSTALGVGASASNSSAVAIGNNAKAGGVASLAIGSFANATTTQAIALGYQAVASTAITTENGNTVVNISFGHKSADINPMTSNTAYGTTVLGRLSNVADGKASTDAATYGQIVKNTTYTASNGSVTVKNNAGGTAFTLNGLSGGSAYTAGMNVSLSNNQISVSGAGSVESGNTGLLSGGTAYTELRPTAGTNVNSTNSTATNLKNLDNKSAKTGQTVSLATTSGTSATNVIKSNDGTVLATLTGGSVASGNTGFVSGGQVYSSLQTSGVKSGQTLTSVTTGTSGNNKIYAANGSTVLATISVGAVNASSTGFVDGKTVYTYGNPTDGTYARSGQTVGANLKALDTQMVTNTSGIATNAKNISTNTTNIATNKSSISTNATNITANKNSIATNATNITNLSNKSAKTGQAVSLATTSGTSATNVIKSNDGTVLATLTGGSVASGNTGFVSGGQVYSSLQTSGVKSGQTLTSVTTGTSGNNKIYAANGSTVLATIDVGAVADGDTGFVSGDAVYDALKVDRELREALIALENGQITVGGDVTASSVSMGNRKITNVVAGTVDTDAVNLSQIKTTANASQKNGTYIQSTLNGTALNANGTVGKNIEALDAKAVSSGKMLSLATTTGENATNVLRANDGTALATLSAGSITSTDTGFISGKTVYEYDKPVAKSGYTLKNVSATASAGVNLGVLDAKDVFSGQTVSLSADGNKLVSNDGTTLAAFTVGSVEKDNTGFVSGKAVYEALQADSGARDSLIQLKNGQIVIGSSVTADTVSVEDRKIAKVAAGTADTDAVNVSQIKTTANTSQKNGTYLKSTYTGTSINTEGTVGDNLAALDAKAVAMQKNTVNAIDLSANGNKLVSNDGTTLATFDIGDIAENDFGFINGDAVYDAFSTRVGAMTDGTLISSGKTAAANIAALDEAIGAVLQDGNVIVKTQDAKGNTAVSMAANLQKLDAKVGKIMDTDAKHISADHTLSANVEALDRAIREGIEVDIEGIEVDIAHIQNTTKEKNATADGKNAIALGDGSHASALDTISLGTNAAASGNSAIAVGAQSTATGDGAVAVGYHASATEESAVALGNNSMAVGEGTAAIGGENQASGRNSVAVGSGNRAVASSPSSEGIEDDDVGLNAAVGVGNMALGAYYSNAVGIQNQATASNAVAIGTWNQATGEGSVALGYSNLSIAQFSMAIGASSKAGAMGALAVGYGDYVSADGATAIGFTSAAFQQGATAIGYQASATKAPTVENGNIIVDVSFGHTATDIDPTSISEETPTGVAYGTTLLGRLANVAEGKTDTDAVNFSQIKTEANTKQTNGTYIQSSLNADGTLNAEGTVGKNIAALDAKAVATTDGTVNAIDLSEAGNQLVSNDGTVLATFDIGAVEEDNTGFINGDAVYQALKTDRELREELIKLENGTIVIGGGVTADSVSVENRKITNVVAGSADTDAVNFSQIKTEANLEQANGTYIQSSLDTDGNINASGTVGTNIAALDAKAVATTDGIVNAIDLSASGNQLVSNDGTTLAIFDIGAVEEDNTGFINGDAVYQALKTDRELREELIKLENGTIVIGGGVVADSVSVENRKITNVVAGNADTDAVNFSQIQTVANANQTNGTYIQSSLNADGTLNAEGTVGKNIAALDAKAVATTDGTVNAIDLSEAGNQLVSNDGTVLATFDIGAVEEDNTGFINGDAVYQALKTDRELREELIKLENGTIVIGGGVTADSVSVENRKITNVVAGNADTDAVNFSQIQTVANANQTNGTYIQSSLNADGTLNENGTVGKNIAALDAKAVATTDGTVNAIDLSEAGNQLVSNDGTVLATFEKGTIEDKDTGFVTGGMVYDEFEKRVGQMADGKYISSEKNVAENLTALDDAMQEMGSKTSEEIAAVKDSVSVKTDGHYAKTGQNAADNIAALDKAIGEVLQSGNIIEKTLDDEGNLTVSIADNLLKIDEKIGSITDIDGSHISADATISDNISALDKVLRENIEADISYMQNTTKAAKATADGENAIALGEGSHASGKDSISLGTNAAASGANAVSFGANATASAENAIAVGNGAQVSGDNSLSIGNGSVVTGQNAIAVGTGHTIAGDNSGAFGDPDNIYGTGSYAVGNNNTIGEEGKTSGSNTFVLGNNVTTTANDAVLLGSGSTATEDHVVSVGSEGNERKIVNVAAGVHDTDAVNVVQLKENLENVRFDLTTEINKVAAGSAALAALRPETYDPDDKVSFAIGYGHYQNANAGAVGAFYKPNASTTFSAGFTIGDGNPMVNMGLSFKLGTQGKNAGLYRSNVELVREVNTLRADNESLKAFTTRQAQEIQSLKADNAQMKADNARMQAQIAAIMKNMEMSQNVNRSAHR